MSTAYYQNSGPISNNILCKLLKSCFMNCSPLFNLQTLSRFFSWINSFFIHFCWLILCLFLLHMLLFSFLVFFIFLFFYVYSIHPVFNLNLLSICFLCDAIHHHLMVCHVQWGTNVLLTLLFVLYITLFSSSLRQKPLLTYHLNLFEFLVEINWFKITWT